MRHYDLCVIGSGPAGQKAAIQAAKLGRSVCIVERREVVGGVTVNTGTIPSKALREAILASGRGVTSQPVPLSGLGASGQQETDFLASRSRVFSGLLAACHKVIRTEIETVERHLSSNGVEVLHGTARFRGPNEIEIQGQTATGVVSADRVLIAVGTVPARPDSIPFDAANVITSDEMLSLPFLPHSMIIVGGGVIGTEYASMMTALGVKVTLVEGRPSVLDFVDREVIEALQYHLRRAGMTLRCGEKVVRIETIDAIEGSRTVDGRMAQATLESGKTLRADCLLYAIGRQGATETINLEAAGLEADGRGRIRVDEDFRTAVEHIYACGDVIGFPALASTSMEQGRLAARHMFGRPRDSAAGVIPFGIYAIPEISMVGWTEEQLTREGIPFESGIAQYEEIARGQLMGDTTGMLKLLIHQESHHILGVHIIGTDATELIHIGQTAMAFNATVEYFVDAVFNYPTLAECYKVAALNGLNKIRGI